MVTTSASASANSEDSSLRDSQVQWSQMSSYLSKVATEHVFDLPPLEEDLGLLRQSFVISTLCHAVYCHQPSDVGSKSHIELPLEGVFHDTAVVEAKLIHFREAEVGQDLASPQQYGIWEVEGLGLVVAFRGTASAEDVFIDANIVPVPLRNPEAVGEEDSLSVHRGFYEGVSQVTDSIVEAITEESSRLGKPLPVWITGHSLGGAYANCFMLHLLEKKSTAKLFAAGGGAVTFGAPMVLHSGGGNSASLYRQLEELESFAEAQSPADVRLHFHNFVNNADIVPRLLGTSLDTVHESMEWYIPSMKAVRQIARGYHPFGAYHLVVGSQVRSLRLPSNRLGNAAHAAEVNRQLNMSRIWKSVYATSGKGAGVTHHSISSYQERLVTHMTAVARGPDATRMSELSLRTGPPSPAQSLFAPSPGSRRPASAGAIDPEVLDHVGRVLSSSAQAAASKLGTTAYSALSERWSSYKATAAEPGSSSSAAASWASSWLPSRAAFMGTPAAAKPKGKGERKQADEGSSGRQNGWLSGRRWSAASGSGSSEDPPATWKELGGAVSSAVSQYMQRSHDRDSSGQQDL